MTKARILESSCWPYSGQRYEVWVGKKCVLRTDLLDLACRRLRRARKEGA